MGGSEGFWKGRRVSVYGLILLSQTPKRGKYGLVPGSLAPTTKYPIFLDG